MPKLEIWKETKKIQNKKNLSILKSDLLTE